MRVTVQQLVQRLSAVMSQLKLICEPHLVRVRGALAPYWRQILEWYDKREPREKLLLRLLAGVVAILLLYDWIYAPINQWRSDLAAQVSVRQHQIIRLRAMMRNFERLQLELASTQKRTIPGGKDPALFSVLQMILANSVGREKIASITPNARQLADGLEQYTVDVKLNDIGLSQIVDTLYSLQTLSVPLTISNLQIRRRARDSHTFDVDLTCMALGKAG
jgi:hypothetical protein